MADVSPTFVTVCSGVLAGVEVGIAIASLPAAAASGPAGAGGMATFGALARGVNQVICTGIGELIGAGPAFVDAPSYGTQVTTSVSAGSVSGAVSVDASDDVVDVQLSAADWTVTSQTQINGDATNVSASVNYYQQGQEQTLTVDISTDNTTGASQFSVVINGQSYDLPANPSGLSISMDNGGTVLVDPSGNLGIQAPAAGGGVDSVNLETDGNITLISADGGEFSIDGSTGAVDQTTSSAGG
jgi:hypothetical protein